VCPIRRHQAELTGDERELLARLAETLQGDRDYAPSAKVMGYMPHPFTQADVLDELAEAGFEALPSSTVRDVDLVVMGGSISSYDPNLERQSGAIPFEELLRGEFRIEPARERYSRPYVVAIGPDGYRELELQKRLVEKLRRQLKEAEARLRELKARRQGDATKEVAAARRVGDGLRGASVRLH
jgi:hypothetical protein